MFEFQGGTYPGVWVYDGSGAQVVGVRLYLTPGVLSDPIPSLKCGSSALKSAALSTLTRRLSILPLGRSGLTPARLLSSAFPQPSTATGADRHGC